MANFYLDLYRQVVVNPMGTNCALIVLPRLQIYSCFVMRETL